MSAYVLELGYIVFKRLRRVGNVAKTLGVIKWLGAGDVRSPNYLGEQNSTLTKNGMGADRTDRVDLPLGRIDGVFLPTQATRQRISRRPITHADDLLPDTERAHLATA